jgi:hypothetical protein
MALNRILALDPSRTLRWLEDPAGNQFNEMVREWRESEQRKLRSSTEDFEVYRAQGALKYLDMIFEMPQEIKSYMHDVATGKRRPVDKKEFEHGVAG